MFDHFHIDGCTLRGATACPPAGKRMLPLRWFAFAALMAGVAVMAGSPARADVVNVTDDPGVPGGIGGAYIAWNTTGKISKYGCYNITNGSPTGYEIYIPLATADEWNSFLTHLPEGVTAISCGGTVYVSTSPPSGSTASAATPVCVHNLQSLWRHNNFL